MSTSPIGILGSGQDDQGINDSVDWIQSDAMYLIFPAGMLLLTVLALTVLGDGLRDALDTRTVRLTSR